MQKKYEENILDLTKKLEKITKEFDIIGYVKLALIFLEVFFIYQLFKTSMALGIVIANLIMVPILIAIFIFHYMLDEKIKVLREYIEINNRYISRINGEWTNFPDTGEEFVNLSHSYSNDLDIVGKKSLFQLLNITGTWYGRKRFAQDLLDSSYDESEIIRRQDAIKELGNDMLFMIDLQHKFSKVGIKKDIEKFIQDISQKKIFMKYELLKLVIKILPCASTIFIAGVLIFTIRSMYLIAFVVAAVQMFVWLFSMLKLNSYLEPVSSAVYKLAEYSEAIDIIRSREYNSQKLKDIKNGLYSDDLSASRALKELSKVANKVNVKHNGVIYFILNVLLLWDYECAFEFESWMRKYSEKIEEWFYAIGEFESLLSFANLQNINKNVVFPKVVSDTKILKAKGIGHPLINSDTRIVNNIEMQDNIIIISGSNMSGKTTFLRTLGVSIALAKAGSMVCAEYMSVSPFKLVSSMRISDDLEGGISTFYAELKRIKMILDEAQKDSMTFFMIDEIFKGTNSIDRLEGAKRVIEKLDSYKVMGLITTHDLELCELEKDYKRVANYSFSEKYNEKEIMFDYKIKKGKSTTTNAKYLMDMLGI